MMLPHSWMSPTIARLGPGRLSLGRVPMTSSGPSGLAGAHEH